MAKIIRYLGKILKRGDEILKTKTHFFDWQTLYTGSSMNCLSSSYNCNYLYVIASGGLYRSIDGGLTFNLFHSGSYISGHVSENNGVFVLGSPSDNKTYYSINSGSTWGSISNYAKCPISMSSDGKYVIYEGYYAPGVCFMFNNYMSGPYEPYIEYNRGMGSCLSENGKYQGCFWQPRFSGDGNHIIGICRTDNSGSTWNTISISGLYGISTQKGFMKCSNDGKYWLVGWYEIDTSVYPYIIWSKIWKSSDYGLTFDLFYSQNNVSFTFSSCSYDGKYWLIVSPNAGYSISSDNYLQSYSLISSPTSGTYGFPGSSGTVMNITGDNGYRLIGNTIYKSI
jgi:hypothetical protein